MEKIQVAIADDDTLIVKLLTDFLISCGNYSITMTACNGMELLNKLKNLSGISIPDVLLLDLKMQEMNGIEVLQYLRTNYPSIKVIVISSYYQENFLGFMFKNEVCAFFPKGITPAQLKKVINSVYLNGYHFTLEQLKIIRDQISVRAPKPEFNTNELSSRETEIIKLICTQKTSREISEILYIAPKTVEGHKNKIFVKTGAKNVAGLVIYAVQNRIFEIDEIPKI